jgi:hypothetical protein
MGKPSLPKKAPVFFFFTFTGIFLSLLLMVANAQGATKPQMLITWQAHGSYVPPSYHGKALPNWASQITASLLLLSGNLAANLQNQTIYWYADDTLIGGGQGMQTISFVPAGGAPNLVALKAELPDYPGGLLVHTIQIPIVQPKAVIEAGHPSEQFGNPAIVLQGTPYFFGISDPASLSFVWSVNGTAPATAINPQVLQLNLGSNIPSGSTFVTALTITDPQARISGTDSTNIIYVKQL